MRTRATRSSSHYWSPATFQRTAGLPGLPDTASSVSSSATYLSLPADMSCLVARPPRLLWLLQEQYFCWEGEKNRKKREKIRAVIVTIAGCLILYAY